MAQTPTRFRGILKPGRNSGGTRIDMGPFHGVRGLHWTLLLIFLLLATGLDISRAQEPSSVRPASPPATSKAVKTKSPDTVTLIGAGDMVGCLDMAGGGAASQVVAAAPGKGFAAGDLAYESGPFEEFQNCYGP